MKKRLLYVSAHSTLERYDTTMFTNLGFEVFSSGFFQDPQNPTQSHLSPLSWTVNKDLLGEFKKSNPTYTYGYTIPLLLTKEFVKKFDVIVISWRYDYLDTNWDLFKDKLVLFETLGQSDGNRERQLSKYRAKGVKLIRVSETEKSFPSYAGADLVAGACIDVDRFQGWTGEDQSVLTINSAILEREEACNTNLYLNITKGLKCKVYGTKNDKFKVSYNYGAASEEELLNQYRKCRVYFSLGSKPAPLTYTAMEAMSTGCPVVTWGPNLGNFPGHRTYATCDYIDNGVNGYFSDNPHELRQALSSILSDLSLATKLSTECRKTAVENFSTSVVQERWKSFLNTLGVLP